MSRQLSVAQEIRRGGLKRSALACSALFFGILTSSATVPTGHGDPEFSELPFEQWLSEGEQSGVDWSAEILPAEITVYQRLLLRVVIRWTVARSTSTEAPASSSRLYSTKTRTVESGRITLRST